MLISKRRSKKLSRCDGQPPARVKTDTYSAEIFEDHIPFIHRCHVILEYGEPILVSELSKEEKKFLGSYTQQKIQAMLDKNKALL